MIKSTIMRRWGTALLMFAVTFTVTVHGRTPGEGDIDIIIESRAQGQNNDRYREVEGEWSDSQIPPVISKSSAPGLSPQGRCGARKFLFLSQEEPGKVPAPAAARFYPRVDQPGRYHVYVTWPTSANAVPVLYTVRHAAGEDRFPLAQEGRASGGPANASRWISLGAFDFATGDEQYVEIRDGCESCGSGFQRPSCGRQCPVYIKVASARGIPAFHSCLGAGWTRMEDLDQGSNDARGWGPKDDPGLLFPPGQQRLEEA